MRVVVRTDASHAIGSGHVMRCLTLARLLRIAGAEVGFVCRLYPGNLVELIRAEGFACDTLPSLGTSSPQTISTADYASWLGGAPEQDAAALIEILAAKGRADWLIVDHYGVEANWERRLRPWCDRLMVIDDLANRPHECDLLLDQNLAEHLESRYHQYVGDDCVKLLGSRYALLQPDYVKLHLEAVPRHSPVRRVFAYFGAADAGNICGRIVRAFSQVAGADICLDVVATRFSQYWSDLSDLAAEDARVCLHGHLPSLAPLLREADVAFGAGGATSWERCCLGVPAYVVTLAENQVPGARALAKQGAARWLGHAAEVPDAVLLDAMREALAGESLRTMSDSSLTLVDGWGGARVVARMLAGPDTSFVVRLLAPTDERLTFDWANDPEVRRNSFSTERIDALAHRRWLFRRMADLENCRFYVVETVAGLPVGPARFECLSPGVWEIHYSMDRCLRGRGVGAAFLKCALDHFRCSVTSANLVIGRVKLSNQASQHIFRKLGFSQSSDGQGFHYHLNLKR